MSGTSDNLPVKILNGVRIQSNGIIRNSVGNLIGRLSAHAPYNSEDINVDHAFNDARRYMREVLLINEPDLFLTYIDNVACYLMDNDESLKDDKEKRDKLAMGLIDLIFNLI